MTDYRNRTTGPRLARLTAVLLTSTMLSGVPQAMAQSVLPTGGSVAAGSAAIGTPSNGTLTVTQSSSSAVVNWQSFSVGQGNTVNFVQPSSTAAILNRVTGSATSTIAGQVNANGQVFLVNPNGIAITSTGTVNAAGFVASTLGISDSDFMSGKRTFTGNGASAGVSNAGTITIGRGGYAALLGGSVDNAGTITVPLGKVGLGSGEQATLDLSGDGFMQVAVPTNAAGSQALISNSGRISAHGGSVQLSAAAARNMARQAINMSGTIEAKNVGGRNGAIVLGGSGGVVAVSGKLNVASRKAKGGSITVTGRDIKLAGATLDASGKLGGGNINVGGGRQGQGTLQRAETLAVDAATVIKADATQTGNGGNVVLWSDNLTSFAGTISAKGGALSGHGGEAEVSGKAKLAYTGFTDLSAARGNFGTLLLDPYNVIISSGADTGGFTATGDDSVINVGTLQTALSSANVTVSTGSSGTQVGDIIVDAPLTWSSNSLLTLSAARRIAINADITVTGGGQVALNYTAPLNFGNGSALTFIDGAQQGTQALTINGTAFTLLRSMDDLSIIDNQFFGAGYYALAHSLDATGRVYDNALLGSENMYGPFSGVLEGLGHTITNLTIVSLGSGATGLIGGLNTTSEVRNIGLVGGSVTGPSGYAAFTGGLVGANYGGTISNAFNTGTVSGDFRVGGLVGVSYGGTISNVYATGSVSALGNSTRESVGGLIGEYAPGPYPAATVTNAYATGAVSGGNYVGGLIGRGDAGNGSGSVTHVYATGAVHGTGNYVGGLAGSLNGVLANAYATGTVSGVDYVGGLAGTLVTDNVSATNYYATGAVSGRNSVGGLIGDFVGTLRTAYATGTVVGTGDNIGGLIGGAIFNGFNLNGTYATGSVSGAGNNVGGLVGLFYVGGSVSNSYATGAVTGTNYVGGLVGFGGSLLSSVYATGAVSGVDYVGGLVGSAQNPGITGGFAVHSAYATGAVSGTSNVGGLVGSFFLFNGQYYGLLRNVFWNVETSGQSSAGVGANIAVNGTGIPNNPIGLTTAQFQSNYNNYMAGMSGFNNGNSGTSDSFAGGTGGLYPYLPRFNPNGVQAFTGTAYSDAGTTPLASGASGAVTVGLLADGSSVGTATTGANGYYYIAVPLPAPFAPVVNNGQNLLAYTASGVPAAATLATAFGGQLQTGLNLYGNALTVETSATLFSQAPQNASAARTLNATALATAAGANAAATAAINGALGLGLFATGSGFTIDQTPTINGTLAIASCFCAPINVNASIVVNNGQSLGLLSGGALAINAPITATGAGSVALAYDASSPTNLTFAQGSSIDFGGANQGGTLSINNQNYTLLYSMTDFEQQNVNGFNAIATDLNAGTYMSAVVASFDGSLEGLGHTLSNLTIGGNNDNVGLIGRLGATGTIRDLGVVGGSVSGYNFVGGLVGFQGGGTISNVYTTGIVRSINYAGGLVGLQDGGSIINAYAMGAVSGNNYVGGLVGLQWGSVSDAFATGAVSGHNLVGGLVGVLEGGTISNAYAMGAVSGHISVGGLVGVLAGGTITNAYWDTQTSGQSTSAGGDGLTTAQLQTTTAATNLGAAFAGGAGLYPYLRSFFPIGVQVVSGTAYTDGGVTPLASGTNGAATVSIASNGQTLSSVTTGANGYYYAFLPMGTLASTAGVAAYTQADGTTGAQDAVSYVSGTPGQITSLDVSGGWRRDKTLASSLSTLDAGFATTTSGTPVAGFTLPNRAIFAINDFVLDSALNVPGTLALASPSNVTQTAAFAAGALILEGSNANSFTLTNTGNQFGQFAASGGGINVYNASSLTIAASLSNACNCVVTGVSATGAVRIATAGDLTIASGAAVSGSSPVLAAAGAFINNAGSGAVVATAGNWLIYAADSAGNTFGGLDSGNTAIWNTAAGGTVTATGNRYVFAAGRTLTVTTQNDSKTYGEDVTGRVATDYVITGFDPGVAGAYVADTASTAYSGTASVTSSGAAGTANVAGSPYAITAALGSLASNVGYGFTVANTGALTVGTRAITVTANAQTQTYGNATPTLTYTVGGLGLVNGETLSGNLVTSATSTSSIGSYTITQGTLTNANNDNYAITYTGANNVIGTRAITVTANAQMQTYGNATPTLTYTVGGLGLVNGETLSGNLVTSATSTSSIGSYTITQGTLTNANNGNYAITYTGANLTVGQRALTVTADALSRIYGNANPALTYAVGGAGLVNGDALTGSLATTATTASNVGSYGITEGSLAASTNYAVTYSGANLTVGQRGITVTADARSRTYGDANPALTYTVGSAGLANGDTLSGALATTATMTSNVGSYSITQGSLAASANYAVTYAGANLTVGQRALTVTANALSRIYGNANPALTYAVGGAGLVNGDALTGALETTAITTSNVGSYGITQGSLAASTNYAVTYAGADLTVGQRALTVAANAQSRTYGNANPALTYTVGGAGLVNGDALLGSLATTATSTSNVGAYGITQGSLAASTNYAVTYAGADLTVGQRALTVAANALSRAYGDANPTLTYTVGGAGLVNGDTLSGSLATTATTASNVGSYGITQGALANGNYAVTYSGANLTVGQRSLTVTADALSRAYGDANPTLTYTVGGAGLVNGDTLSGALATTATTTSNVGSYGITQGSLAASTNYAVTYTGADLAVGQRALTVTADAQSRIYGNANPALTYTVGSAGLVNGDTLSGALATTATTTSNVGSYGITQGSLANGNYAVTYSGANLTVTRRALTVAADALSRAYGDLNPTLTYTATGLVNGDTLSGSLSTTAGQQSSVGAYGIAGSFSASSNYVLTYVGGNLTVNPRALVVTANSVSKTYGAANPPLTYAVGARGLVNGDLLSGVLTTSADIDSAPGSYAIARGDLAASANYNLIFVPGMLTVDAAISPLTSELASTVVNSMPGMIVTAAMLPGSFSPPTGDGSGSTVLFADPRFGSVVICSGLICVVASPAPRP